MMLNHERVLTVIFLLGTILAFNCCASVSEKNSPLKNQAALIETVIKNNPQMSETDKAILKAGVKDLKYADKVIIQQDKENDKLDDKLVKEAKEAGAGKIMYVVLGLIFTAIVAFVGLKIMGKLPF
jgi:hypothetical protein